MFVVKRSTAGAAATTPPREATGREGDATGFTKETKAGAEVSGTTGVTSTSGGSTSGGGRATGADVEGAEGTAGAEGGGVKYCTGAPGPWSWSCSSGTRTGSAQTPRRQTTTAKPPRAAAQAQTRSEGAMEATVDKGQKLSFRPASTPRPGNGKASLMKEEALRASTSKRFVRRSVKRAAAPATWKSRPKLAPTIV